MVRQGVECEDSRDEEGRERFLPMNIDNMRYKYTKENKPFFWYWRYTYYPARDGLVSPQPPGLVSSLPRFACRACWREACQSLGCTRFSVCQGCCSKRWISTHYIFSKDLYRLDEAFEQGLEGAGKDPVGPPPP